MDKSKNIPKIIHYCWFGNNPKTELVKKCIESWKKYLLDYELREWNDKDLKGCDNIYVNEAYRAKKYAFVSDYFRLYALYNYGGIYLDTDNEVFKSFDEFLNLDFFSGYETWENESFPFTAVVGAKKGNKIIKELLDEYENLHFLNPDGSQNLYTNTRRVTDYFQKKYKFLPPYNPQELKFLEEKSIIFPNYTFCNYEKNISHAVHHFNGSWVPKTKESANILKEIFSVRNEYKNGVKYKVLTILGIKHRIKGFYRPADKYRCQLKKHIEESDCRIINIYEKDTKNIGDLSCAPCLYFPKLSKNAISIGIKSFSFIPDITGKIIIVGGGGLFLPYFESEIKNILQLAKNNKVVIWGVGFDNYIGEKVNKINLSQATLVGIRDFAQSDYNYVPCASCLSPLFDTYRNNKISHKYAFYLHNDYSKNIIDITSDIPVAFNKDLQSLDESLKFLSSAEYIFTNSFHGLYWATLLGKKVAVLPWYHNGKVGFSNKFQSFKYKPVYIKDIYCFEKYIYEMKSYPNALQECRNINNAFYKQVIKLKPETLDIKKQYS